MVQQWADYLNVLANGGHVSAFRMNTIDPL